MTDLACALGKKLMLFTLSEQTSNDSPRYGLVLYFGFLNATWCPFFVLCELHVVAESRLNVIPMELNIGFTFLIFLLYGATLVHF